MSGTVRIGISGHQDRPGIDWDFTAAEIRRVLVEHAPVERAFSSLAVGSDQLFTKEALALGIPVTAVIPMPDYARFFTGRERAAYDALLARCEIVELSGEGTDEEAFFAAGRMVADSSDLLIAVWDGEPAQGLGGTGDIVRHCLETDRIVIRIDPVARTVAPLKGGLSTGDR